MPDLHGWISQQIDATEAAARRASPWTGAWHYDDWSMQVHPVGYGATVATTSYGYSGHIVRHDPAAILRRCAADRKILEQHCYSGGICEPYACAGCGHDDMGAWVEHANDCETLQALAEGYGLTDDELAQLDRPQSPERQAPEPEGKSALQVIDEFLWGAAATRQTTTPTSAVPAALRGPNWKAQQ